MVDILWQQLQFELSSNICQGHHKHRHLSYLQADNLNFRVESVGVETRTQLEMTVESIFGSYECANSVARFEIDLGLSVLIAL